jgi:hypothetical protein
VYDFDWSAVACSDVVVWVHSDDFDLERFALVLRASGARDVAIFGEATGDMVLALTEATEAQLLPTGGRRTA